MKRVMEADFDFQADDPERLLSSNDAGWLFRSVQAVPAWTERALAVTAATLSYWTGRAIVRDNREEIGEIRSLILRIIAAKERDPIASGFYTRFEGMAMVLESRMHMMDHYPLSDVVQNVIHRPNIVALREAISAKMDDSGLVDRDDLGISDTYLSLAESAGLIRLVMAEQRFFVAFAGPWKQ